MKTIAVLLTVYNRKTQTLECLRRLYKQDGLDVDYVIDVWLTDDGCTDGTSDAVQNEFPNVHIIKGDGTLFWNRGMWTAWDAASKYFDYDFYLWLNDDTYIYHNAIATLFDSSKKTSENSIVVGVCQSLTHASLTYGGRNNGCIPPPNGELIEVDKFNGNIVFVPQRVFHIVGNLDYTFRHSQGDYDYGWMAAKHGIKSYQVGWIIGECDRHVSLPTWCNPKEPLKRRWKALFIPTGYPPMEQFYANKKYHGFINAVFHTFTIYLRCFFPQIWVILNKASV